MFFKKPKSTDNPHPYELNVPEEELTTLNESVLAFINNETEKNLSQQVITASDLQKKTHYLLAFFVTIFTGVIGYLMTNDISCLTLFKKIALVISAGGSLYCTIHAYIISREYAIYTIGMLAVDIYKENINMKEILAKNILIRNGYILYNDTENNNKANKIFRRIYLPGIIWIGLFIISTLIGFII